ncbi:MAG: prephenate dehydrogenase [Oscillospiraceae bacterium]|nr:prephenate dehydrogenase [Oscillospiraceae bacterium]
MTVGVVGLGLIGGSFTKAYKRLPDVTVYGQDIDKSIEAFAQIAGAIDAPLTNENIGECDCLLIVVSPRAAARWLEENACNISPETLVIDCCGTKRRICEAGFRLAEQYGFEYVGGHPMAGTHQWGFRSSKEDMFDGASMVVVPRTYEDINLLERIKQAVMPVGFASMSVTTAEKHDELIAFTSQLAHVVSNAYIKSPTAKAHSGFSAGSYQDLTRVAWLNPDMWADLFLENDDMLLKELDIIIGSLNEYRAAIADRDFDRLRDLLDEGRICKEEVDGGK